MRDVKYFSDIRTPKKCVKNCILTFNNSDSVVLNFIYNEKIMRRIGFILIVKMQWREREKLKVHEARM